MQAEFRLLSAASVPLYVRGQLWAGALCFLLLSDGPDPLFGRGDHGGVGGLSAALLGGSAMKVIVVEKRKGFWGFFLRRLYGVKKLED